MSETPQPIDDETPQDAATTEAPPELPPDEGEALPTGAAELEPSAGETALSATSVSPDIAERLQKYLDGRWQGQRDYFSQTARRAKRNHRLVMLATGILGVTIPFLIALNHPVLSIIAGVCGILVSAITVIESVNQYGEQWRTSRLASEALKRERWLLDMRVGEYRTPNPEQRLELFVERVEAIIGQDVAAFSAMRQQQQSQNNQPPSTEGS